MIAALYVETDGTYFNQAGIDPWDEKRDARLYKGDYPVIAHPPCQRWGKSWAGQPLWIARTGERKQKGADGGCFQAALDTVRRVGGVIEHPWGSYAWPHFGLNKPARIGGWAEADEYGGWTCCVEQGKYGHYARKPTMLYVVGTDRPELLWGKSEATYPQELIDRIGLAKCKRRGEVALKGGSCNSSDRIATPQPFKELLISLAKSVYTSGKLQTVANLSHNTGQDLSESAHDIP